MTHHKIRTLPDGSRLYSNYSRYKPLSQEERKYKVRKPDDPRAVRFRGDWFLPLELTDDEARVMPATRPDEQTLEHRGTCICEVCTRPAARIQWKKQYWREVNAARKKPVTS